MLKLERLELSGFKSFVDPVGVDFAGRMTAIVGPNGCGKSNLSDAVVWVLGERSAKTLRGDTMEDVIFGGAAGRKPLGMAEVSLTFSADADFEGADDHRLTIGRRIHRDGQSVYLLNGKRSRLKEIRDSLMDTGLGIRAYSVIEQGKIGLILSGKPQERRRLLEEAAGITRYKERRRIAEIKLEEARGNLSRLDDIVSEVERALRSLKRQASAARRLQERKKEHQELLQLVLLGRWADLHERQSGVSNAVGAEVSRESELNAALHREEADLAEAREELERLAQHLAEQHRSDSELAAKIEGKQEFLKGARHRLEELGERINAGDEQSRGRESRISELGTRLVDLGGRLAQLVDERDGAATVVTEDDQKIDLVQKSVADSEELLEDVRGRLLTSLGQVTSTRDRLHQEQLEHEKGSLRRDHLVEELEKKSGLHDQAKREAETAASRVAELETTERERTEAASELEHRRQKLESEEREAGARVERLSSEISDLRRRLDLLEELARAQAARREEVRKALGEAGMEELTFLAERLEVPEGWEKSLDLYLGELADAVVLPEGESAIDLALGLAESHGTFRLLEADAGRDARVTWVEDPAVVGSLSDSLGLPTQIGQALPPAFLVQDAVAAERLARAHPGVAFISRDRFVAEAGVVRVQGREASPGQLAREQELARLEEKLPPLEQKLAEAQGTRTGLVADLAALLDEIEGVGLETARIRQELAVARARHQDLAAHEQRLSTERQALTEESGEVAEKLARLARQVEGLTAELSDFERAHGELESSFDNAQRGVDLARSERETVRTSGAGRRGQLELLEARLDSERQESARLEAEIGDGRRQVSLWAEESERLSQRRSELRDGMTQAETELQQALESREELLAQILSEQTGVDERRSALKLQEERLEAARESRDELRDKISTLKVDAATIGQEVEHLATSYREEFEAELPEAPAAPERPIAELETDLERCRVALERIGPVNLLAAQEYDEQKERLDYLTTQREDVTNSVASLQRTIREINETSSERFLKAFTEVNEYFGKTFVELFRGGAAEMRLIDEDDPLESGIEIVARPPGKRLQNIMLMSGGEKALVAIALLFALFHTKPSPFCILDEVDAPLDDLNTMRFVELIKKRSAHTQFIVITHNKITMEAASTLYGVTMQERGVSSLVTVELDEISPEGEIAATA